MLLNWLVVDQNDLTTGPPVAHYDRVLAVARGHRLAGRMSVSLEDLVDEEFFDPPRSFPVELADAVIPPNTPSGRPLRRTFRGSTYELWAAVAHRTEACHGENRFRSRAFRGRSWRTP